MGLFFSKEGITRLNGIAVIVPDELVEPNGSVRHRLTARRSYRAGHYRRRTLGSNPDRQGFGYTHRLARLINKPLGRQGMCGERTNPVTQQQKGHTAARLKHGLLDQVFLKGIVGAVLSAFFVDPLREQHGHVTAMFVAARSEVGYKLGDRHDVGGMIRDCGYR